MEKLKNKVIDLKSKLNELKTEKEKSDLNEMINSLSAKIDYYSKLKIIIENTECKKLINDYISESKKENPDFETLEKDIIKKVDKLTGIDISNWKSSFEKFEYYLNNLCAKYQIHCK